MSKEQVFEKDFWIIEDNFLKSCGHQLEQQQDLVRAILGMWKKANELEIERMVNTKNLYDKVWSAEKIMTEGTKRLCEIVSKTNEKQAASQLYSVRAFVTREDLKSLRNLVDLMGAEVDFQKMNTVQFMQFLGSLNVENPPRTCFLIKEGELMRNPGVLSSWKKAYVVITTER